MNLPATKVLVIGYVWPEPRSSAAGGHMMQILETFLTQGWDITFSSPAALGEHKADLQVLGIKECAIELNNSSFDDFVRELAPDIVLFDRFMMEEQFGWRVEKCCPDALRVLETSDLQSLRDARQQQLKARLKSSADLDDFSSRLPLTSLWILAPGVMPLAGGGPDDVACLRVDPPALGSTTLPGGFAIDGALCP